MNKLKDIYVSLKNLPQGKFRFEEAVLSLLDKILTQLNKQGNKKYE